MSSRVTFFLVFCAWFLISFVYLSFGSIPDTNYGHDIIQLYDEAWRITNGQIPHKDFHITIGSGYNYLCYIFLRLNHYDAIAFSWMNVVMTFVFLALGALVLRRDIASANIRQRPAIYIVFALILAFGFGSYCLGVDDSLTFATVYNRYCYALLIIIFAACFLARQASALLINIVCGFCLFGLLVIKMPFLGVGCLLVGIAFIENRSFSRLFYIALTSFLCMACYSAFTPVNLFQEFLDVGATASRRAESYLFTRAYITMKLRSIHFLPIIAIASFGAVHLFIQEKMYTQAFLSLCIIISAFLLNLASWCFTDIPLLVLLSLLVLEKLPAQREGTMVVTVILLLYTGLMLERNISGFEKAGYLAHHKKDIPAIDSGYIRNFYITDNPCCDSNTKYVSRIKEAEALIRANVEKPERIENLDFENPFNAMLGTVSPRNVPIAWQYNCTFTNKHFPDYESTFSDVKLLLIPQKRDPEAVTPLMEIYGHDIDKDFTVIAKSPHWVLMEKKKEI